MSKIIIYQVLTRLFGNTGTLNKPWGTIVENGVGKFADFTPHALQTIRDMGFTHIWYTGVLHHALINDYTAYGITNDYPEVVKGRAGSPYAIKDYYNVNPDLATDPANRLAEFRELIRRTHHAGLKVIIDIVPNHVARYYHSTTNPEGQTDFGASDDISVEYARNNNFYYIPGQPFALPNPPDNYKVLGGECNIDEIAPYVESTARWTGNDCKICQPGFTDWYETVKLNYGIKPDGTKDFPELPPAFDKAGTADHFNFWADRNVPDTWTKMKRIAHYWLAMGVDGFRFDMAEMVPVEFWSYLNSSVKEAYPKAVLIAEVYNPDLYRTYIHLGKLDYLYDKVGLYDTLRSIIQYGAQTDHISESQQKIADITPHMLNFLENHDEQRIANPEFAGVPERALPALVVSATIGKGPFMIYFGQEVGEPAEEQAGFGGPSRTSIFDYISVPAHRRWYNEGRCNTGLLSEAEVALRDYYVKVLHIIGDHPAIMGEYREIHSLNLSLSPWYNQQLFSFVRRKDNAGLIVCCNFSSTDGFGFELYLPHDMLTLWKLQVGQVLHDLISGQSFRLQASENREFVRLDLKPLQSVMLTLGFADPL